jgi:preprotein translocase subunit SecD
MNITRTIMQNLRIVLWLIVLIGAIVAISPSYGDDGFSSNLEFGIEIEGGSTIILELQGNLVQLQGERDPIVEHLIEQSAEFDITKVSSDDETVTFSVDDLSAVRDDIALATTWATTTYDEEANTFTLEVSVNQAHAQLLSSITNGSKVTLVSYEDAEWFEVRRSLTDEEEQMINELTRDEFEEYLLGWYDEQLGDLAEVTALENRVSPQTTQETRDILSTKLNYLGLADIPVKTISDNRYIEVEFAATELEQAEDLITEQGKFEIKIVVDKKSSGQATDPEQDELALLVTGDAIKNVDHYTNLSSTRQWEVPFTLSEEGAEEFANKAIQYGATENPSQHYIVMMLDDQIVFDAPLSGSFADAIESGTWNGGGLSAQFGVGEEAKESARILWIQLNAGALPVKQRIVSKGYTSPALGDVFLEQIVLAGVGAIFVVAGIVALRYRKAKVALPMLITAFSETIIVLGVAVVINHQLDLPSIAGVLATLGTGVDQMVIITDEVIRGGEPSSTTSKIRTSLSKRISRAFSIIFASAATTIFAMIPLAYMQLGVLRGFAIVTIIGIISGVFITRPTYARIINLALGKEDLTSE